MHVRSYLRSLPATYPLSKWATILSVAVALSMQPSQGLAQAGVSASAAVATPSQESGAKIAKAQHGRRMFGSQPAARATKSEVPADDPLAEIKAAVVLPPQDVATAPFVGNATVLLASSANGLVLLRRPNCSLNAWNIPYSYDVSDPYGMPVSVTTSVDQLLHNEAGLTTTGGNFGGKCPDPTIGINSNDLLYVGTSTGGMRMAAAAGFNGTVGTNVLYTFVIQANGSFGSSVQQSLPAANAPFGMVAGDLNGDGNPDIIVIGFSGTVTPQPSAMTVLLGNADGTFTVGQTYMLGSGPTDSAVIDDFNGDGKLDVVVAVNGYGTGTNSSGVLSFFPGKGDGTFGTPQTLALTTRAENLVSGDFNGDGKKDVASGTGSMFLGNGNGTFQLVSTPIFSSVQVGSSPGELQIAAGDFNKDGKLDLAASNGNQVFVVLGHGDGTFSSGNVYAGIGNRGYITATDLDGDGNLDLYSGDAHAGVFIGDGFTPYEGYALMGRGDGTFVGAPQFTGGLFNSMEDLNGDQNLDLIALSGNAATVQQPVFTTYYGNGDGTFSATGTPLAASAFTYQNKQYTVNGVGSYVTADLNGDGKEDLFYQPAIGAYTGATLRQGFLTALGSGNGGFQTPTYTPVPSLVAGGVTDYPVVVENVQGTTNQNGKFEVVYDYVTSYLPSSTTVMYTAGYATQVSNGDGTFAAPAVTVVSSGAQQPQEAPTVVSLADLNGDKIPDLITLTNPTGTTPATLQVMLGKADGTFQTAVNLPVVSDPIVYEGADGTGFALAVGDVNGDGIPDVVAEGQTSSGGNTAYQIGVALGKGDGTFTAKPAFTLANAGGQEQIALGDFTGDGKIDLAITGGTNGIFPGNGDGTFQSLPGATSGTVLPTLAIELGTNQGPVAGYDLNGSGKTDLLAGDTFFLQTAAVTPPNTSATALTASASAISTGQSVTLTATVTASSGSGTPTGTVTFLDGTTSLGTGTLNGSGVTTFSTATLAAGAHSLTATYGGDTNFSSSTSSALTVTVTAGVATATKLSSSAASAASGTSVTFSAAVSAASGSAVPTGTVAFLDGTTTLGTGTLDATGTATYATSALAVGAHSITAAYAGAAGFAASTSSAVSVSITAVPASFSLGLSPATGTLSSGSSATTTITLTPAGGFSKAVSLACSGAPQSATCTISPASITAGGSTPATATMTISASSAMNRPSIPGSPRGTATLAFLGGGAFLSFALLRRHRGKMWWMQLGFALVLLGTTAFTGCGGGSGGNTGGGTYTLTVTGTSGSLTSTATYSLTVQ
jgi:Bacterial Ig-like domain (group 3)/FG-GAP-like repeat